MRNTRKLREISGGRRRRYALIAFAVLAAPGLIALVTAQLHSTQTSSSMAYGPAALARAGGGPSRPTGNGGPTPSADPISITQVAHGSSLPVKNIAPIPRNVPTTLRAPEREFRTFGPNTNVADGALQTSQPTRTSPSVLSSFDGMTNPDGFVPPDVSGDVGPNNYVQASNSAFAIYSKTGVEEKAPTSLGTLWAGLPSGLCKQHPDDGDPVVVYDQLADRWVITQFAVQDPPLNSSVGDYHECFAVSKTSDPTGAYFAYDFKISTSRFDDYPKIGVWPDGYYASFNDFDSVTGDYVGVTLAAFDRSKMLNGQSASGVKFSLDANHNSMLPSDLDGRFTPSNGAPNIFAETVGSTTLHLYNFHADFTTPANSTFGSGAGHAPNTSLTVSSFNSNLCNFNPCVPQPNTPEKLDAISDRIMQQLRYRNLGNGQERLVVNQTVNVSNNRAGVRWYQLNRNGGAWTVGDQGTFAPADSIHRWMGSVAMDGSQDVAVGYSASSGNVAPSIRYAGRVPSDPAGTLEAETILKVGGGSATTTFDRWGDYTTMSVDPTDDCTFWYANEYYKVTDDFLWTIRIGSFRFPTCVGVSSFSPANGSVGAAVTVNGVGFTNSSVVKFNGVSAVTTFTSDKKLTAVVPAGATTGRISVADGSNSGVSANTFTVSSSSGPPTIQDFSPTSGITGSTVTITGNNIGNATTVIFRTLPSPLITPIDATHIQAKVPNGAAAGAIKVTTPAGSVTSSTPFTPTLSIQNTNPPGGSVPGGHVTVNGVGFTPSSVVKFNGVPGTNFVFDSATKVEVNAPSSSTFSTGPLTVTNSVAPVGTVTSPNTFFKRPTVTGLNPTNGPVGTSVTITGTSFTGATSVKFNGVSTPFTVNSKTSITASVPATATTGPVTVANPGGTGTGPIFTVTT